MDVCILWHILRKKVKLMNNKKGFTLVELLGTIAILALLSVIVFTKGFGAFNKTKESINKIEEDNLLEAAKVFLVDVDNGLCPNDIDCTAKKNECASGCTVSVEYLEKHNYFDDKGNHCKDEMILNLFIEQNEGVTTGYKAEKQSDDIICSN